MFRRKTYIFNRKWILSGIVLFALSSCTESHSVPQESMKEDIPRTNPQDDSAEEVTMEQYWEDGTFYTVADEKTAVSRFHYSVAGEDVSRERLDSKLVFKQAVKEESGYTCFRILDTVRQKEIEFRLRTLMPDVVPQITGWLEDDDARINIDLKIANEVLTYPVNAENSRYGVYWFNRNYASADGFSLISYTILPEGQENVIKGGQVTDRLNGYVLVTTGILNGNYDTVINVNTADVREDERKELQQLAEGQPLVTMNQ